MQTVYTPWHYLTMTVGAALIGTDVLSNVQFALETTGTLWDSTILAVIAVAAGTMVALAAAVDAVFGAIRRRSISGVLVGAVLLVGFALGAGFSLTATLDRVASQRDAKLERLWSQNADIRVLQSQRLAMVRAKNVECATGYGPKCKSLERQMSVQMPALEAKIDAIRAGLDPMGQRVTEAARLLGFDVSVRQAALWQPMLLPAALFLLGNFLFSYGFGGEQRKPEFELRLNGRADAEARLARYVEQFESAFDRSPTAIDIEQALGVSKERAKAMAARVRKPKPAKRRPGYIKRVA